MSVKYIIGVDPSLRSTGVSVHDNLGTEITTFDIKTTRGMPDHDSVDSICEQFFDKLEPYMTPALQEQNAVVFYFEHILHATQGKSTARNEAAGVLKWNIRQAGFPIYGIEARAWNSWLAKEYNFEYPRDPKTNRVNSASIKKGTKWALSRFRNYYTDNSDKADAYAIALFGRAHSISKARVSATALCRIQ